MHVVGSIGFQSKSARAPSSLPFSDPMIEKLWTVAEIPSPPTDKPDSVLPTSTDALIRWTLSNGLGVDRASETWFSGSMRTKSRVCDGTLRCVGGVRARPGILHARCSTSCQLRDCTRGGADSIRWRQPGPLAMVADAARSSTQRPDRPSHPE